MGAMLGPNEALPYHVNTYITKATPTHERQIHPLIRGDVT
jgi:hypothetical protein